MKTNRFFCCVALCVMLLATTGCQKSNESQQNDEQIEESLCRDSILAHVETNEDYVFIHDLFAFEELRQDYLKIQPGDMVVASGVDTMMAMAGGLDVETYIQQIKDMRQQGESQWQKMFRLCAAMDYGAAYDFFYEHEGELIAAMPCSSVQYEFHVYVVRALLEKFEQKNSVDTKMISMLELDKMCADMAMDFDEGGDYVPEEYYSILKGLAYYYSEADTPNDKVLKLVDDYRRAQLKECLSKDVAEIQTLVFEHTIHGYFGDFDNMECCRRQLIDIMLRIAIEDGRNVDEEWKKQTEVFVDGLLE